MSSNNSWVGGGLGVGEGRGEELAGRNRPPRDSRLFLKQEEGSRDLGGFACPGDHTCSIQASESSTMDLEGMERWVWTGTSVMDGGERDWGRWVMD